MLEFGWRPRSPYTTVCLCSPDEQASKANSISTLGQTEAFRIKDLERGLPVSWAKVYLYASFLWEVRLSSVLNRDTGEPWEPGPVAASCWDQFLQGLDRFLPGTKDPAPTH